MRGPEGGFYSALDADSEGEEGRFYVWTPDQIREVLGASGLADSADDVIVHYGVDSAETSRARHSSSARRAERRAAPAPRRGPAGAV